jgi:DNA replication protein DnaC
MNEWQKDMISELIDLRYSSGLPTLITSNLSRSEMKSKLSERDEDRIFDKSHLIIEQNESSRRQ